MKKLFGLLMPLFAAGLISTAAYAQDAFRYELIQNHSDNQPAQMRLVAVQNLVNVKVVVSNCGPKQVVQSFPGIPAGQSVSFSWAQPAGLYQCTIDIVGKTEAGGKLQSKSYHDFASIAHLSLDVNLRELSPDLSQLTLHANRPISEASLTVSAEDGSLIDSVDHTFDAKRDVTVSWTPNEKRPALIDIKIGDGKGSTANYIVLYFSIPHKDIVFDTAKSNIRPEQAPYLQDSLEKIQDILSKYSKVAMDLYITGYTDTVGSVSSNDKLSQERAKSIARWFKSHGLNIPTYYRGVGERALAVQTPDETPNEQNRRAVYILSNRAPSENPSLGKWNKL